MKLKTFGPVDDRSLKQLERCMEAGDADYGVLCADHHPGYSQPIGGAVAYEGHVSPSGVGYDIGCGNKAVLTDLTMEGLDQIGGIEAIMSEITKRISFGMGVPARERVDHPVLEKIRDAEFVPQRKLIGAAAAQLGTVGSGNHYVNVMEDEQGRVWVGVHFGSRGFGHKTASGFLALAQGLAFDARAREGEMDSPPVLLEAEPSLATPTSRRCSSLVSTRTPAVTSSLTRCWTSCPPAGCTKCTTTTTSRGGRSTAAAATG